MKTIYKTALLATVFLFLAVLQTQAQYSTKKVRKKYASYEDSLKQVKYNYVFPIWGQGAYKKGFDIPYPIGVMANYLWLKQGILIDNLQLGFKSDSKDIPLTPVDFIGFGDNINTSYTVNVARISGSFHF